MSIKSAERPSANLCAKSILLKENKAIGPLRLSSGDDGQNLQALCREIAETQENVITFTTGLGLSSDKIPLRLPAVIVPTLNVIKRLKEIGIPTSKYIIYQATDFIAETNQIDIEVANKTSQMMEQYLKMYVATFHPDITANIDFRFGINAEISKGHIDTIIEELKSRISAHVNIKKSMDQLAQYRMNNGKNIGAEYRYAAANILFNGAQIHQYPFKDSLRNETKVIIPVGGKREEPFFHMTRAFNAGGTPKTIPLLQRAGEMPTYYAYKGGDIISANECQSDVVQGLSGPIKYDFDVLKADGATLEALRDLHSSIS